MLIVNFLIKFLAAYLTFFESYGIRAVYISALTNLIWIYWITIHGLLQKEIDLPLNPDNELSFNHAAVNNDFTTSEANTHPSLGNAEQPKPENRLTSEIDLKNYELVLDLFVQNQVYLNKDISLFIVAEMINLPVKEVSRLINQYAMKNFNQFVNTFRVEEAKKHLTNSE